MALATIFTKVGSTPTIKTALSQSYSSVEEVAWMTVQSYVRCSSLSNVCARQEVLVSQEKLVRKRKIDPDFQVILHNGHAVHHVLQNNLLPDIDILLGHWKCLQCCKVHKNDSPDWVASCIHRPKVCECGGKDFLYVELSLKDDKYRLTGHTDGILRLKGTPGLGLFEAKSVSAASVWKVKAAPMIEHVIQANAYMWLLGLSWAIILYWDKTANGLESLIEHKIDADQSIVDEIKKTLNELWYGLETGIVPERTVCASEEAPKAVECPVRVKCFTPLTSTPLLPF